MVSLIVRVAFVPGSCPVAHYNCVCDSYSY